MNNNGNRPRRSTGKGILDMHPTQLRRGEGADINPEQLNILKIKTEERIAAAEYTKRHEVLRNATEKKTPTVPDPVGTYRLPPRTSAVNDMSKTGSARRSAGNAEKNYIPGAIKYEDARRKPQDRYIYRGSSDKISDRFTQAPTPDVYGMTRQASSAYAVTAKAKKSSKKAVIIILGIVFAMILIAGIVIAAIFIGKSDDMDTSGDGNVRQALSLVAGLSADESEFVYNNIGISN